MSSKDINQTSGTPSAPLSATDPSTSASAPPDSTSMASLLATTAEQGKALEGKERLVEAIEGPCDSDDEGPWRGRSLIWTARVSVKRVRAVVREEGEDGIVMLRVLVRRVGVRGEARMRVLVVSSMVRMEMMTRLRRRAKMSKK